MHVIDPEREKGNYSFTTEATSGDTLKLICQRLLWGALSLLSNYHTLLNRIGRRRRLLVGIALAFVGVQNVVNGL
jgi:hypothetical protein